MIAKGHKYDLGHRAAQQEIKKGNTMLPDSKTKELSSPGISDLHN